MILIGEQRCYSFNDSELNKIRNDFYNLFFIMKSNHYPYRKKMIINIYILRMTYEWKMLDVTIGRSVVMEYCKDKNNNLKIVFFLICNPNIHTYTHMHMFVCVYYIFF